MEEKEAIEVEIFNESHLLTRQNFIDFSQLVAKNHFGQIKIPFSTLDDPKIFVLNIFLYYIISIQKNFKAFKDDLYGDKYRSLCTKEVSDYYIRNKFLIEEYEFAYMCSKALSIKLQESAHIIYYLVYGRFASHPYINTLCSRKDYDFKRNTFKKGKQLIDNFKFLKKRTFNNDRAQSDQELENFKRQLKNALNYEQNYVIWKKKPRNSNKENKKSDNQHGQSLHATERKSLSRGSSFQTFIPQRISQGQNSSIFQTMPFQKKSYQTCTDWNRKGLMRKQKFNEFFDINDYKLKTKLKKSPSSYFEEKKENYSRNMAVINNDSDQMSKINYENFKNISNNLKVKNTALDKIRTECSVRNHRPNLDKPNFENQVNPTEISAKSNQVNKQNQTDGKMLKLQVGQETDFQTLNLRRNFSSIDGSYLKDLSFSKNFSYAPQKNFQFVIGEEETEKPGDFTINLLRTDDSGKEKENEDGKKLDYFSKTSVGFKKMNCKYKLQKYKSDYRKFMKTQLLDRIKQAG